LIGKGLHPIEIRKRGEIVKKRFLSILIFCCLGIMLNFGGGGLSLYLAEAQSTTYQASTDFSGTQGYRSWYYLDSTGASMTFDPANNRWKGGEQYLLLGPSWGHPGNGPDAVRRWVSPQRGSVRTIGNARDGDPGGGDGVMVSIRKGASVLWQQVIENGNTTGFNFDVTATVAAGEAIDFVINKRAHNYYDSTHFDPKIVLTPEAPDTSPPTVSITYPPDGATVRGTITVTANASDNVGVARVEFYVDGSLRATDTSSPYSYDLDTTQLSNGSHAIKAKAYDAAGNNAEHQVTVSVENPPSITYHASADFSGKQGYRSWYYLDSTGASMTFDPANNWWKGGEQYLLLGTSWGHPGNGPDAVRRWVSPQRGSVRTIGNARDTDPGGGDGVMVSIRKGASVLWQQVIENGNMTGFNFDVTATVVAGEAIDFVINKRGNNGWDATYFDPRIVLTPEAPDTSPPSVSITYPPDGATVRWTITVTANASDNVGVARLEFYVDGSLRATDASSPYSYDLDTTQLSNGSHTLMAKAYDAAGNNAEYQVTVTVSNGSPPNVKIQIGPLEVVRGPDMATDNPFNTLMGTSSLLAYIANGSTWGYLGGSLETLRPLNNPVLQAGANLADFDYCGAWLCRVWQDGTVIRGWYHAETDCDYSIGRTHMSVAYAESYDGGRTFVKPNYPNNQVITAPPTYTNPDLDDEGDHRVIRIGDYLYLYFLATRDWRIHLARSHILDGGRPATWQKYYNGSFNQPGLTGESSAIADWRTLGRSWVSYNSYLNSYLGLSGIWPYGQDRQKGWGFAVSPDGLKWIALPYLVLPSEGKWVEREKKLELELANYPSLISIYGDSDQIGDTFWLYYMYINPYEDFDQRYLVRRKIHISTTTSSAPIDLVPRIALSKYQKLNDTWFTTTNTDPTYQFIETIGYLFTDEVPNSIPLYDCYIDSWNDHVLVPNDKSCGGERYLRPVGWISTVPFANSIRVYRCWDPAALNHFISTDPNCEGKTTEWPMGYLAVLPPLPQNQFVALSNYHNPNLQDNWATTSKPPLDYLFLSRIGYLFTNQKAGSVPLYDCYIDFWTDHMVVPNDATCGGGQNLGLMGWIATEPFPGSVPIYRCFDEQVTNHFVSLDPACDGKRFDWRIGYIATKPVMGE
jgi:hypothetical protein